MWSVSIALVCRILLAVVLAGSGIGKLQDLDDSRQMMVDFGLPYAIARPAGTFLPGITLAVGLNMAAGRRPDCRCFGSLHVATIGWRVLSRNLLLMALAAVVLLKG